MFLENWTFLGFVHISHIFCIIFLEMPRLNRRTKAQRLRRQVEKVKSDDKLNPDDPETDLEADEDNYRNFRIYLHPSEDLLTNTVNAIVTEMAPCFP